MSALLDQIEHDLQREALMAVSQLEVGRKPNISRLFGYMLDLAYVRARPADKDFCGNKGVFKADLPDSGKPGQAEWFIANRRSIYLLRTKHVGLVEGCMEIQIVHQERGKETMVGSSKKECCWRCQLTDAVRIAFTHFRAEKLLKEKSTPNPKSPWKV